MKYQRQFEGSLEQVTAIREFVGQAVKEFGGSEDDVFACQLASDEAASNIFEHAYAGRGGRVVVEIAREGDHIAIQMRDWGASFDPARVAKPNLDLPLEERPIGGLGIFLIWHYMQDVAYTFDPIEGNTITMKRKISQERA